MRSHRVAQIEGMLSLARTQASMPWLKAVSARQPTSPIVGASDLSRRRLCIHSWNTEGGGDVAELSPTTSRISMCLVFLHVVLARSAQARTQHALHTPYVL